MANDMESVMSVLHGQSLWCCFFFQAEDGIRYLVRSRGLGDVYKRQFRCKADGTMVPAPPARVAAKRGETPVQTPAAVVSLSLIHI